ncbi:MAG: DUF1761 domain-containing protein [Terracidiphilus sp.]|jgi:hypothetical protein
MSLLHFNHLHVFAAALLQWLLGALWYSPVLFAKPWKAMVGVPSEAKKSRMILGMIASFVGSLMVSFMLMHVLWWSDTGSLRHALLVGLGIWIGFIFAPLCAQYIYEGRPFKLLAINTGYWLVALLASCAVLVRWH